MSRPSGAKTYSTRTLVGNWFEQRFVDEAGDGTGSTILKNIPEPKADRPFRPLPTAKAHDFTTTQQLSCAAVESTWKDRANRTGHSRGTEDARSRASETFSTTQGRGFIPPGDQRAPFEERKGKLARDPRALREYRNRFTRNGPLLARLRKELKGRGVKGIREISGMFRRMDNNGDRALSHTEFMDGMKQNGFAHMSDEDLRRVAKMFDTDGDGVVDIDEFLQAVRPPLSKRREDVIEEAWKVMDANGDGVLTVEDIAGRFKFDENPQLLSGEMSVEDLQRQFLDTFEPGKDESADGMVTRDEFLGYLAAQSASIDHDMHFVDLIRNAYKV